MADVDLLTCNLPTESDLQNFVGFVLGTVQKLGGSVFAATLTTLELTQRLRDDGAGSGYPLPAELALNERKLSVRWCENQQLIIAHLANVPRADVVEQVSSHLRQSTEINDPGLLLKRNVQMMRYLGEARARMEQEVEDMQQTLTRKQEELAVTMRKAETDQLTGLLNRRAYDEKIEQSYKRTLRLPGQNLSLILCDLDYFKSINDEFGHQYGDEYLKKMAAALLSIIRQDVDYAFRFGGDEFAVLIFADKTIAGDRALQLLSAMDNKVSMGIACLSAEFDRPASVQDFIKRADDALYEAKHAGRGRVIMASREPDGKTGWETLVPGSASL